MPRFCTEFSLKPDYEISKKRYDAFWSRELIDRPPVSIYLPAEKRVEIPERQYPSPADRWLTRISGRSGRLRGSETRSFTPTRCQ